MDVVNLVGISLCRLVREKRRCKGGCTVRS
jgi:hypothetical protein